MSTSEEALNLLNLMLIPGIRGGTVRRLLRLKEEQRWSWNEFWGASQKELLTRFRLSRAGAMIADQREEVFRERDRISSHLAAVNATAVACYDPIYPESLRRMPDYPPLLICKGNMDLLKQTKVGVLSSRNPSWRDVALIGEIVFSLRKIRAAIVSGAGAIQHYVPGYWGLLSEIPVIWILDRGLLMALDGCNRGHLVPFARMDGRLWRENVELAISPFSPEDVGTPGGIRYRDRVLAYLADDLVGWGIRKHGYAIKVLEERHRSGGRVVLAVRQQGGISKDSGCAVPTLILDETLKGWWNWLIQSNAFTRNLVTNIKQYLLATSENGESAVVMDLPVDRDLIGPQIPESSYTLVVTWKETSHNSGGSGTGEDTFALDPTCVTRLKACHRVIVVTSDWEERVVVTEDLIGDIRNLLGINDGGWKLLAEPLRDYRSGALPDYRRVHRRLNEIWGRTIKRLKRRSLAGIGCPRALAVVVAVGRCLSPGAQLAWMCLSGQKPRWFSRIAGALGLAKADGNGVGGDWEMWAGMVRYCA
ncbi:MAG: DNA-processing protein DprA [bacterium JZ-2024 1]